MKIRTGFVFGFILSCALLSAGTVLSQDEIAGLPLAQDMAHEAETQWIWGDVVSVDKAARSIKVKYLDYDTDTEKEMAITADDNTKYENVNSFDEIKPQDTLSIDYKIGTDASNIAVNISVERPESVETSSEDIFMEEDNAVTDSD